MNKSTLTHEKTNITDQEVIDYLRQHPNFLAERPSLIAEIELVHAGGAGTTSLIERQVEILRERNITMRHRLDELIETARRNDQLFEKTRKLTISLIKAKSLNATVTALFSSFDKDFGIEQSQLILLSDPKSCKDERIRFVTPHTLTEQMPSLSTKLKIFCGQLTDKERDVLFQHHGEKVKSAAVVPLLVNGHRLGALAIGNQNPQYYRSSMDTLFLAHIGDIFSQCLKDFLPFDGTS